jgi:hypothetical protein
MHSFLLYIGAYNFIGSLVLPVFLKPALAQKVLGDKGLQVLGQPYDHGAHGPMWIWWAMMTNLGLALIMVLASSWPLEPQRGVTEAVIVVYAIGCVCCVGALRSPRYRKSGIIACLVLWIAQIAWGAIGLWRSYS